MVDVERRRHACRHLAVAQASRQLDDVDAAISGAAARLPFSMISFEASTIAIPLAVMEREPPVPLPAYTMSLSPCSSLTLSKGTPSSAQSTCAKGVACPCP